MKRTVISALAGLVFATALAQSPAKSEEFLIAVLSQNDVQTYRAIFTAQDAGDLAKADAAISTLHDKALLGYVRQHRYLLPRGHISKYSELTEWMRDYGELADAGRIYRLAQRKEKNSSLVLRAPARLPWRGGGFDVGTAVTEIEGWTNGLAAFRAGRFADAARAFEDTSQADGHTGGHYAASLFWAARSWLKAGEPARLVPLFERASSEWKSFYGLLAACILGFDARPDMHDPRLDLKSFAALMENRAAYRAVALSQIGRNALVTPELKRAFGELPPEYDEAFAALARHLQAPEMELRAAETASEHGIYLTSLFPVPDYTPRDGYTMDKALLLAFAQQESRFADGAISRSGTRGVMQIMSATARYITGDRSLAGRDRTKLDDPVLSMTLGQSYLYDLLRNQNGNLFTLAAAYNTGPGRLSSWLADEGGNDDPLLFLESIPREQPRNYVKRVVMNMWMYRKRFGEKPDGLDATAGGDWPIYAPSHSKLQLFPVNWKP